MNQENQIEVNWEEFAQLDEKSKIHFGVSLFEALQLELAKTALERVLQINPNSLEAIDHYTDVLEQLDQEDQVEQILKGILIEQNEQLIRGYENSYKLFFKYGQTQNGQKSIQLYELGIKLLEEVIKKLVDQGIQVPKQMLRDIADAHSAIAEVYQTDLLHLKSSEQQCQQHINLAFQYDQLNLDAFLQLANFHLNKEDEEKAKEDLRVIYDKLMESTEDDNYDEEFKLQVTKLLVEVEDYQRSASLAEKLVEANEKNFEYLYMLAFGKWKLGQYAESLNIANGIIEMPESKEDQEIFTATSELITELQKQDLSTTEQVQNLEEEEWMDVE